MTRPAEGRGLAPAAPISRPPQGTALIAAALLFLVMTPALAQQPPDDGPFPDERSHRDINPQERRGIEEAVQRSLGGMDPEQARALLESLRRPDSGIGQGLDPEARRAIEQLLSATERQSRAARDTRSREPGAEPAPSAGGRELNERFNDALRQLEASRRRQSGAGSPGSAGSPETRDPAAAPNKWERLIREIQMDPQLRGFMSEITKRVRDAAESRDESGERSFPWLEDPRFPQEMFEASQESGPLDEWTRELANSSALEGLIRRGLEWRRSSERASEEPEEEIERRRQERGDSSANGETGEGGARPRTRADPTTANSSAARRGLFSWRMPELPQLIRFRKPDWSAPRFGAGSWSRQSSLPRLNPRKAGLFLGLVFLAFIAALLGRHLFRGRVRRWVESSPLARRRAGWSRDPRAMRSTEDFLANYVQLRDQLYTEPEMTHEAFRRRFHQDFPEQKAPIGELTETFEKAYYTREGAPMEASMLKRYGDMLMRLARLGRGLALLIGFALLLGACQSQPSVGEARSLWRMGEGEALDVARAAAERAAPEDAPKARRLVVQIALGLGSSGDAILEYRKLLALTDQHDDTLLRSISRVVLLDALQSWDVHRRARALEACRPLEADPFLTGLLTRAERDQEAAVRVAAIDTLAAADPRAFARRFRLMVQDPSPPVRRAALERYAALLSNHDFAVPPSAPLLARVLTADPQASVRRAAVELERLCGATEVLAERLIREETPEVRLAIGHALARSGDPQAWSRLWTAAEHADDADELFGLAEGSADPTRSLYLGRAARAGLAGAAALIDSALSSREVGRLIAALTAARQCPKAERAARLEAIARHPDPEVRGAALLALVGEPERLRRLAAPAMERSQAPALRALALESLEEAKLLDIEELERLALGDDALLAEAAIERLGRRAAAGLPALVSVLARGDSSRKVAAIRWLGQRAGADARNALLQAVEQADDPARRAALIALAPYGLSDLKDRYIEALDDELDELDLFAAAALLFLDQNRGSPLASTGS